ncbi:galactose mutarotase [Clostridium tyrobutyricum]|jgi:aldose 1-epimerase|uniref:aldose epimerase family protein n=1 Tax=Clostridium tyrobutyricum TaxID=1519 RepID=UPI00057EBFCB|nr:aldose epimerase family protein [Clostridium tyrobutyricum]MBV4431244.1 galactose mutarotase [Clostridium tyrobutyricum]MBV4449209.1 galactose mutarotase [Clostridium tyrobutyricum]
MLITKKVYGKTYKGEDVYIFNLSNDNGMTVKILNYGGIINSIKVPDRNGKIEDVVLGYDNLDNYIKDKFHFGAIIGRHANRIENAVFEINGIVYNLTKNDGKNHIHGGLIGFDKVVWESKIIEKNEEQSLELYYTSVDGEEGYPGNLEVKVTYTLMDNNALKINYHAVSDKDTVVNLTNHSYFNLSGHQSGNILEHQILINADKFTVNDKNSIPTGEMRDVKDTPMDFTQMKTIGAKIYSKYKQIEFAHGYDNNWVLRKSDMNLEEAAEVFETKSGRVMEVYTTKPGVQFYTGNYIEKNEGKEHTIYDKYSGLCLETQYFPNSLKHKNFPSPILKAGEVYNHTTVYKFLVR